MAVKKRYGNALGRGLDALISTDDVRPQGSSTINEIPLTQIEANPNQPRREFDPVALQELANSIREIGIIQPITLRQVDENRFQIIAGERRWRASQIAGLTAIPAYIRTIKDENVMEMALVENIQREDLNAIEIALAYEHLLSSTGMTQEKVSERVGKSRTAIANYLRLLKLPAQVQMALQNKEIDMGHARALLAIDSPSLQVKLFKEIQKNGYSVVREFCGHGVGLQFHEKPEVEHVGRRGTGMLLVPGMIFTIEPMINMGKPDIFIDEENGWTVITEDEQPSAQWENTVLITETGVERLTW